MLRWDNIFNYYGCFIYSALIAGSLVLSGYCIKKLINDFMKRLEERRKQAEID